MHAPVHDPDRLGPDRDAKRLYGEGAACASVMPASHGDRSRRAASSGSVMGACFICIQTLACCAGWHAGARSLSFAHALALPSEPASPVHPSGAASTARRASSRRVTRRALRRRCRRPRTAGARERRRVWTCPSNRRASSRARAAGGRARALGMATRGSRALTKTWLQRSTRSSAREAALHRHVPPGCTVTVTVSAPGFAMTVRRGAHGADVIHPLVTVAV